MTAADTLCRLCGLPSREDFCCTGCRNVYAILRDSGVLASGQDFRETDLYRRSLELGLIARPEETAQEQPVPATAETRELVVQLSGLWCAACGWLIERALLKQRGVVSATVLFASDLLKVRYCPQYVPVEGILERVRGLGYGASACTGESGSGDAERKSLLLRAGIAGFVWLNVMTLSTVLYVGLFQQVAGEIVRGLPFLLAALAAPAIFYAGWPILRVAWRGLRMESLLALGILAAYAYSVAQAFTGGRHFYFDTACAIVTLVLVGKLIERGAKEKTARAVTLLYRLMPRKARLLHEGQERFVSIEALESGMEFVVKAGERVPADGVVIEGESHVDESVLTGEAAPVAKAPGGEVICGSVNGAGVLRVRATRVGAESTLARVIAVVEAALGRRSDVERAVDRVARVFVPAVVGVAALTFAGWMLAHAGAGTALMHAISVLVIACPCALGIATPLAVTMAIGAAGRRGILISDARVLETVRKVDVMVLDKTGTVTEGAFELLDAAGDEHALALAAALETYSEHPVGRALARPGPPARGVRIYKGMGITGAVEGKMVFAGNRALLAALNVPLAFDEIARAWESEGRTVAFYGYDGRVRGAACFGDRIKPDAAALVAELKRRGIRTVVVSGDAHAATAWAAAAIGADGYEAEALPERKAAFVAELQRQGAVVAMAGDGVNDAPSLAQADLGIALGSGADIAMQAAPVVLMGESLRAISGMLDLAGTTMRIVRQNLFWAFAYNTVGIGLAAAGLLHPILAAGAMVLSSASVIRNSLRCSAPSQR